MKTLSFCPKWPPQHKIALPEQIIISRLETIDNQNDAKFRGRTSCIFVVVTHAFKIEKVQGDRSLGFLTEMRVDVVYDELERVETRFYFT